MSETEKSTSWLSRKEVAQLLATLGYRVSPERLSNMANNNNAGNGPPYFRFGPKTIRYREDEVRAWLEKRMERVA